MRVLAAEVAPALFQLGDVDVVDVTQCQLGIGVAGRQHAEADALGEGVELRRGPVGLRQAGDQAGQLGVALIRRPLVGAAYAPAAQDRLELVVPAAADAARFLLLTDVAGVLDKNGELIPELTVEEAQARIEDGTISGGMIPKIETCIEAIRTGARAAVIFDGRVPHACLVELFTPHGVGTIIRR